MMIRRRLPIGIQTFRTIREEGHYYVDKTAFAARLVEEGTHYFLSRPRRFGKSLFLDTLKELFEGNEPLFRGLQIHDRWDWSVRYPVVRLSFGSGSFRRPDELHGEVMAQLDGLGHAAGVEGRYESAAARFRHLIRSLHERAGQRVAVLVDEYDKPILDTLETPEVAKSNRDFLAGFYGTIKDCDAHVRFTFLTGVSKFSKVNLFSTLNNLIDLTLEPPFSAICGYTETDLDAVFAPELPGLDRDRIRDWYNGYGWRGPERVYNPFDMLLLFRTREFRPHWFETGSPTFLIRTLLERGVRSVDLEAMQGEERLLGRFDVGNIGTEALLFQTGYLTIVGEEAVAGRPRYRLGYPNREVRQSLNEVLLTTMTPDVAQRAAPGGRLAVLLGHGDLAGVEALLRAFFASIPYEWHTRNEIARYEGYYASVFYSCFAAAGLPMTAEESSGRGRVDLAVRWKGQVFLFEFKVVEDEPEGAALAQLRERGYAGKYRAGGEPIHLVGVEFSRKERNIVAFETETV